MTYSINLAENDIKRIIAEHIGNCKPENVFLRASTNDGLFGGTVVTASVTLNGPFTADTKKKEEVYR
jgi:hypothetical protein